MRGDLRPALDERRFQAPHDAHHERHRRAALLQRLPQGAEEPGRHEGAAHRGRAHGLERRRAEQEARCRDAGVPFTDDIFVVGDIDGAFMVPKYANQLFRTFVRTFNIGGGKCGLHRLRHTFATELIMSGVNPKTVSNWLGHTDPSFTLKIYVSSSPENLRASVDTVNEVMALPEGYAGQGSELPARIRGDEKKEEAEEPAPDPKAPRPVKIISWESLACG